MIYLDHNATTPVLPEVFKAVVSYQTSGSTTSVKLAISLGIHAFCDANRDMYVLANISDR